MWPLLIIPAIAGLGVFVTTQADDALEGWGVTQNPGGGVPSGPLGSVNQAIQLALLVAIAYGGYRLFKSAK
ncbi:MAG: hypothetical protein QE263_04670 [Vampirovibrionales bacterium]|nr:hypothetical protein [Vampirovibrionales bacterium]